MLGKTLAAYLTLCTSALAADACTRDWLKAQAEKYVAAQTAGKISDFTTSSNVSYTEDFKTRDFATGILSKPLKVDFTRSLYDTTACAIFTEIVAASNTPPYVLGTQLRFTNGVLSKAETLATTTGDWFFNAANTLKYSKAEDWAEVPAAQQNRAAIQAAGDAYLDLFGDKSVKVPWGHPCARLEGGTYMQPDCNVGVPSGMKMTNRRYVIDEVVGAVDIFLGFGGSIPDSHSFRLENGTIRYVHTLTIMRSGA
ncbi:hypothetical protein QBC47DRAFT_294208 [Echria macrotheca]|uniref:DUF8021 domain-containing protein n=1 Tax=Echria macrotheca TaxID=438768 RepID=A0AAJ0BJJ9_9PEZI|nr:hypothetical protein QBC47DRAFT_294208 [Echria macrotheca]